MIFHQNPIPNLFIVGAMKSGTTSLHHYLNNHPNIFMSHMKEPAYFVEEINWQKGEQWYLSLFQSAGPQHLYRGESSTDYAKIPIHQGVPERIKAFNSRAKIIFVLRDPFDRIVSHYWFAVRHLSTGGLNKDFYAACKTEPQYISYSNYPLQIRPYLDLFGKDQVLIVIFEELIRDPRQVINSIFGWLEIEKVNGDDDYHRAYNARPKDIVGVNGFGILNRIAISDFWDRLSPHFPSRLKVFAKKLSQKTINPDSQKIEIERLRREIHADLLMQTEEVSQIIGRDLTTVWQL